MDAPNSIYDLAVAWTWKYDAEFVRNIQQMSAESSLSVLTIDKSNVEEVFNRVRDRSIHFRYFLDRASDEDELFQPMARLIEKRFREPDHPLTIHPINPLDLVARASDKATMHLEFLSHGINVPYTIIVSPFNHKKEVGLSLSELAKLGRPFIIKPANTTGGGIGVVTGAESLKDVIEARQHHRNDKYLLQETVRPALLGTRRAWFRVFYAFGGVLPCWWDDETHVYVSLQSQEEVLELGKLRHIADGIRDVCKLDFFSTEVALTPDRRFVVVDYVNEMCDMRFQSEHPDGVPDLVVREIIRLLIDFVKS